MAWNYLSTSGTVQSIQGNDDRAPYAYWDKYTYKSITTSGIEGITNQRVHSAAMSLAPGEYTCLEISFDESLYVGHAKCYFEGLYSPLEIAFSYPGVFDQDQTVSSGLRLTQDNIEVENLRGNIRYYDHIYDTYGYFLGDYHYLKDGETTTLISADYNTVVSGSFSSYEDSLENKTIYQIIKTASGESSDFVKITVDAPTSSDMSLNSVGIAPVLTENNIYDFSYGFTDHDVRDELRWWYSDDGTYGHVEGQIISLDEGATITGNWSQMVSWSGSNAVDNFLINNKTTIRQTIPSSMISTSGDGIRITLSGSSEPLQVDYMSYAPSNSSSFRITFQEGDIYQEDLKGPIVRWKNDGYEGGGWEGLRSRHSGHFEGESIPIDIGGSAIMYSANVIGIPAQSNGLEPGDFICIYGTEYYDGYYAVLTYSTAHIVVIWGIFDPEVFTAEAEIRRVISLGPEFDAYGEKQDCRAVTPLVQIQFVTGQIANIIKYSDYGKLPSSVQIGPDDVDTTDIAAIYDVVVDGGWICNSPGPLFTPGWEQSIPDLSKREKDRIWADRYYYDDSKAIPDIGYHDSPYSIIEGERWNGSVECISESNDPDYEGDATGWDKTQKLFDRRMAQPPIVLNPPDGCLAFPLCYEGPVPVKFIVDLGKSVNLSKYRFWVQTWFCPPPPWSGREESFPCYPAKWRIEASDHGEDSGEWDILDEVDNYDVLNFVVPTETPDDRVAFTCTRSNWNQYRNLGTYRYYRIHVIESWTCVENYRAFECFHVAEIDLIEHNCTTGIRPTITTSPLYMDEIRKIEPDDTSNEHAKVFYALSFDNNDSFDVYMNSIGQWRKIVKNDGGQWKYFDGLLWRSTDIDKPEENTVRFALWYAFCIIDNRMNAEQLSVIPEIEYQTRLPYGGYISFALGLVSDGYVEAAVKSINITGTIYNPNTTSTPTEITFSGGNSGCVVPAYSNVVSDWINSDVIDGYDIAVIMDLNTTASAVPRFQYDYFPKFFYRDDIYSYDLSTVDVSEFTTATGVVLVSQVETRQSNTITLPSMNHPLPDGALIRISGCSSHYDGYHLVVNSLENKFDIEYQHWFMDNLVPSGAFVQRRFSVGPGNLQPDFQVGSILEFVGSGEYFIREEVIDTPSGYYWTSSNVSNIESEEYYLFDNNEDVEYHSARSISMGPVYIDINLAENKSFYKFRFKASTNSYFWYREYPSDIEFQANISGSWTTLMSGSPNIPIGYGRYSDWDSFTNSGSYGHYRLKINDCYGDDYACVRLNKMDLYDGSVWSGYSSYGMNVGFESKYLFDNNANTEFVASGTPSHKPEVIIDFKNNPKELVSYNLVSASTDLYYPEVSLPLRYKPEFPKEVEVYGSESSNEWDLLHSYAHPEPQGKLQSSGSESIPSGVVYPYRYYKFRFLSNQDEDENFYIRLSSLDLITNESNSIMKNFTTESGSPYRLTTLSPDNRITGGQIIVDEGIAGGYYGEAGNVVSGTYNNSFWTIVDQSWKLENKRAISQVGIFADSPTDVDLKVFEEIDSDTFNIDEVETITHSGTGWEWFVLSRPYIIDDDGDYYLGWYQPNYPVKMSFPSSGMVHYEYGNYTGTTITLPHSFDQSLSLAVRYTEAFSIGTSTSSGVIVDKFSPAITGRDFLITNTYGPVDEETDFYLYSLYDPVVSGTDGQIQIKLYFENTLAGKYGVNNFYVTDNGHLPYDLDSQNIMVSGSQYYSYRELSTAGALLTVFRFDCPTRLSAFRLCGYTEENYRPAGIDILASSGTASPYRSEGWTEIYTDEGYDYKSDQYGPWVYVDYYDDYYDYYEFKLYHYGNSEDRCAIDLIELIVQTIEGSTMVVSGSYGVVQEIQEDGLWDSKIKLLDHAGLSREIKAVYNTFTHHNQNDLSPGSYFYRGENTLNSDLYKPTSITLISNDETREIDFTYPEFIGLEQLAWHKLNESSSNFLDSSGRSVTAYRNGNLVSVDGNFGDMASQVEGNAGSNAVFTLPKDLEYYTVAFWFKPKHNIYDSYEESYDIMGGYISYGAIPGSWYISLAKHMVFTDTPYPPVQYNSVSNLGMQYEDGGRWGHMVFGNYGGCVITHRFFWSFKTWYHVVFSFHGSARESNPYKCWINGARAENAIWQGHDNGKSVYPPPDTIMVDPDDIHYNDHDGLNCMYFGLPLEGGDGAKGDFALQHVMHFGKELTDEEVFSIYRLQHPLDEQWDRLAFSRQESIELPSRMVIDLGEERCVTKYGLITDSSNILNWRFMASGILIDILDTNYETPSADFYDIVNVNPSRYYIVDFISTQEKAEYILLTGIRLSGNSLIPSVSGSYYTSYSGIHNGDLLNVSAFDYCPESNIIYSLSGSESSISGNQTQLGVASECDLNGLGNNIVFTNMFESDPTYLYPYVSYLDLLQTTWSAGPISYTSLSGTFLSGSTTNSDWLRYNNDVYNFVIIDVGNTDGNIPYSSEEHGYLMGGTYVCSGIYMVSNLQLRSNDIISIPLYSTTTPSGLVKISNYQEDKYVAVLDSSDSHLVVEFPYYSGMIPSGSYIQQVIAPGNLIGCTAEGEHDTFIVMSSGVLFDSGQSISDQEIYSITSFKEENNSGVVIGLNDPHYHVDQGFSIFSLDLTSNITPAPFKVYTDGVDEDLFLVADGSIAQKKSISSVVFDLGEIHYFTGYRWYFGDVSPSSWSVYGSNDSVEWTVLDTNNISQAAGSWFNHIFDSTGYRYYEFKFSSSVEIREIQFINHNVVTIQESSVLSTSMLEAGARRIKNIDISSYEPGSSLISHAVTFDGGNTYKIYDSEWIDIVRFNSSKWQYLDGSWKDSEDKLSAFRSAVEESLYIFTSSELSLVEEYEWHQSGCWDSVSGTIGFMAYLHTDGNASPKLSEYLMNYVPSVSGFDLVPSGYAFKDYKRVTPGFKAYAWGSYYEEIVDASGLFDESYIKYVPNYWTVDNLSLVGDTARLVLNFECPIQLRSFRFRGPLGTNYTRYRVPSRFDVFYSFLDNPTIDRDDDWVFLEYFDIFDEMSSTWLEWGPWVTLNDSISAPHWLFKIYRISYSHNTNIFGMEIWEGSSHDSMLTHDFVHKFMSDSPTGRDHIDGMRIYIANPTVSGKDTLISEVSIEDYHNTGSGSLISSQFDTTGYPAYKKLNWYYGNDLVTDSVQDNTFISHNNIYITNNIYDLLRNRYISIDSLTKGSESIHSIMTSSGVPIPAEDALVFGFPYGEQYTTTSGYESIAFINSKDGQYMHIRSGRDSIYSLTTSGFPACSIGGNYRIMEAGGSLWLFRFDVKNDLWRFNPDSDTWDLYSRWNTPELRTEASICYDSTRHGFYLYGGNLWEPLSEGRHGDDNDSEIDATPAMTNYSVPSPYRVLDSSHGYSHYGWEAFDHNEENIWWAGSFTDPVSVAFDFYYPKCINKYRIKAAFRRPKTFTVYGSNLDDPSMDNDQDWDVLDERVNISDPGEDIYTPWFTFVNGENYRYYRFKFIESQPHLGAPSISDIELVESKESIYTDLIRKLYGDFWFFNIITKEWSQLNSTISNPGRYGVALAYNSQDDVVLLLGGSNGSQDFMDVWIYNTERNSWRDMSSIYGTPLTEDALPVESSIYSAAHYDEITDSYTVVGGGTPLSYLSEINQYDLDSYVFDRSIERSADGNVAQLSNGQYKTGGVSFSNTGIKEFQLTEIPVTDKIYYAKLVIHYDPSFRKPSWVDVHNVINDQTLGVLYFPWIHHEGYMSTYVWSNTPIEAILFKIKNTGWRDSVAADMTSHTTPHPHYVEASSEQEDYPAWKAFNNYYLPGDSARGGHWRASRVEGDYITEERPEILLYDFGLGNGKAISSYRFRPDATGTNLGWCAPPKTWLLQGSNVRSAGVSDETDSTLWITLDSRDYQFTYKYTGIPSDWFDFDNTTSYEKYRFVITDVDPPFSSYNRVEVAELLLIENGSCRITDVHLENITCDKIWSIPDEFNLLESAYTTSVEEQHGYATPAMTSNTTPTPYVVTSIAEHEHPAWHAFNQSDGYWHSYYSIPVWIKFYFGDGNEGKTITAYRIRAADVYDYEEHTPQNFQLSGSNDDVGWAVLDARSYVSAPRQGDWTDWFIFPNTTSYKYYKLDIFLNHGRSVSYLGELQLSERSATLPTRVLNTVVDMTVSGALPVFPANPIMLRSDLYDFGGDSDRIDLYTDSSDNLEISFRTQVSGSSEWNTLAPTWNGSAFSYVFYTPQNIQKLQVSIKNTLSGSYIQEQDIRWVRALHLVNCGDGIGFGTTVSGVTTSGVDEIELPLYYSNYDTIQIYNNSFYPFADARVLPRYSGDYDLDRTIIVSGDSNAWSGVNTGLKFPEDLYWESGYLDNCVVSEDKIYLDSDSISGSWLSPVVESLDPSSTAAYLYVVNPSDENSYVNQDLVSIKTIFEVRAGYEKPMELFLVTGVNSDQQNGFMAPWKAVLFSSDGSPVGFNYGDYGGQTKYLNKGSLDYDDEPYPPRRYWSSSDEMLYQFYGALDSRGFAAVNLGLISTDDYIDPDEYVLMRGFPNDGNVYSSSDGSLESDIHIYDYTNYYLFPIFARVLRYVDRTQGVDSKKSWHMVDVVYRPNSFFELYQEEYFSSQNFHARSVFSYEGDSVTPESDNEIDYLCSFAGTLDDLQSGRIRCAACPDTIVHEAVGSCFWLHYALGSSDYFKTILVNDTTVEKEFTNIERSFNFMVEAGEGASNRGFWGLTQNGVYWYEYDGSTLGEVFGIESYNGRSFGDLRHGSVDFMNNIWFIDHLYSRVLRVNFQTRSIDYARLVQGAASVACSPMDNSAYIYVIMDPEFPNNDCVKIVHAGDYDHIEPEVVCSVPNIPLINSSNINLITRSTSPINHYGVLPQDTIWGPGGSLEWIKYSSGGPTLPKGIYKQFRVTLQRDHISSTSPAVEHLRLPIPALINKIPYNDYKKLYVTTVPRAENIDLEAGTHTLDLLVWWPKE